MSKDDGRVGHEFEKSLKSVFDKIKSKHKFDYHRYTDTKAAGRMVNPQPADFQICFKCGKFENRVIIVEAKASEMKESLRECASGHISPTQVGKHKAWLRAGGSGMFWFYCESTGIVEFWDSEHVVKQRSDGKPLQSSSVLHSFNIVDIEKEIISYFEII